MPISRLVYVFLSCLFSNSEVTDVYASVELDSANKEVKNQWMAAFVDVCYSLILDDGFLKGMLTNSPSTYALEALASTEFMTVRRTMGS